MQDPTRENDDQAAAEPSRAKLHVHGPGSSMGRLSMTKFMRVHASPRIGRMAASLSCFVASHPRAKKPRHEGMLRPVLAKVLSETSRIRRY